MGRVEVWTKCGAEGIAESERALVCETSLRLESGDVFNPEAAPEAQEAVRATLPLRLQEGSGFFERRSAQVEC